MEVETLFKRTPEFYADIERQAKKSAQDLAALLTREEIADAVFSPNLLASAVKRAARLAEVMSIARDVQDVLNLALLEGLHTLEQRYPELKS